MYAALYAPADFSVVRATADKMRTNGLFEKAVKHYTKALDIKKDVRCLLDRSVCHLKMGNTMNALADAELAMYMDRRNYRAFLTKAEALFYSGDFETALIFYYRGRRIRPDVQNFSVGIENATTAIKNCVGTPDTVKLTLKGDLSPFYDKLDPTQALRRIMGIMTGSNINLIRRTSTSAKKPSVIVDKSVSHQKTVHQLLGQMYPDHTFLEKVLDTTVDSTPSDAEIHSMAEDALKYLNKRADFWRNHQPIYSRLYNYSLFRKRYGRHEVVDDTDILDKMEKIQEDLEQHNFRRVVVTAQRLLRMLQQNPKMPNTHALQGQLHANLGTAFLEMGQYADALMHHKMDHSLSRKHKIAEGLSRSTDNLAKLHFELGEYDQAIRLYEHRLSQPNTEDEGLWLSQELSKCYLKLGKPTKALFYAQASIDQSSQNDERWTMQGNVLAGQCKLNVGALEGSLDHFNKALDIAKKIDDLMARESLEDIIFSIRRRKRRCRTDSSANLSDPHEGTDKADEHKMVSKRVSIQKESQSPASSRKRSMSILKGARKESTSK